MRKMMSGVLLTSLMSLLMMGCPELTPFSVTGSYAGQYAIGAEGEDLAGEAPLSMTLSTSGNGLFAANTVTGTLTLDFSTNAIAQLLATLGLIEEGILELPPIPIKGVLAPDGTLLLNSEGLLEECTDVYCIRLGMAGTGIDTDADGKMNTYQGSWAGAIQKDTLTVPLYGTFNVSVAAQAE